MEKDTRVHEGQGPGDTQVKPKEPSQSGGLSTTVQRELVESATSVIHPTSPTIHSAPPAIRSTSPTIRSAPPTIRSAPPAIHSAPPAIRSASPAIHSAPATPSTPSTSCSRLHQYSSSSYTSLVPNQTNISKPTTFWKRLWKKLGSKLSSKRKKQEISEWRVPGLVCIMVGNNEVQRSGVVSFDTGSRRNLISSQFLRTNFPELIWQTPPQDFGTSITGRETYQSIGIVEVRWWAQDRLLFQTSSCYVIESEGFDLAIGYDTIDKLRLFKRNTSIIAPIRSLEDRVDVKDVDKDQRNADAEREQAKKEKKRIKKEKKEREQSNKHQPSS